MGTFTNKVIWITGASSGIGHELALQLSQLGARLIVSARNQEALESLKAECAGPCFVLLLDLTEIAQHPTKVEAALAAYGQVDILINNAGLSQRSHVSETTLETHRKLMEVNYFGTVALTREVLPLMRQQGHGHIVVTSSLAGKFGFYQRSAYAASKFALHGFFETLRLEEAHNGISVSILCPGGIKTNISYNALNGQGEAYGQMSELQENGMAVDLCARKMIRAIAAKKKEAIIGQGLENISVKLKGIWPSLFWKILKSKKPTDAA